MSSKKKIAILGSGRQGVAAARDSLQQGFEVILCDGDQETLTTAAEYLGLGEKSTRCFKFDDESKVDSVFREADGAVLAADYSLNLYFLNSAIKNRCHTIDFGGNHDIVNTQHRYQKETVDAGVSIVPDTGLTPGLAGILVAGGVNELDEAVTANIRVGGLPLKPEPPLNYSLLFSVRGLTNEYLEESVVMENGEIKTHPSMTGLETLQFDNREFEAFYTSGGVSTLPKTFGDRLKNLDCKTIRYPGHANLIRFAFDIGFNSEKPVKIGTSKINPRQFFETMLQKSLSWNAPDETLMRVTVAGKKGGLSKTVTYEMHDKYDESSRMTSMQRCTAFPGIIFLQSILRGDINKRGVLYQELEVDCGYMIDELAKRGITITKSITN
ncbi:hypothetical protein K8I28_17205 [bacterium]|nr:hypothetical protein [bacterium]